MLTNTIDKLLDKAQTPDFWRGLIYLAAGAGVVIEPALAQNIIAGTLLVSGLLHTVWHKQHPEVK
jgi:hypothetical protein